MNRRQFLGVAAAIPFGGMAFGNVSVPSTLFLPGTVWETLASAAHSTSGFVLANNSVTRLQSQLFSTAFTDADMRQHLNFLLGFEEEGLAHRWLLGDGRERRLREVEVFARQGAFLILPQPDGVLLLRK